MDSFSLDEVRSERCTEIEITPFFFCGDIALIAAEAGAPERRLAVMQLWTHFIPSLVNVPTHFGWTLGESLVRRLLFLQDRK